MKKLVVAFLLVVLTAGAAFAFGEGFSCLKAKALAGDTVAQFKIGYMYEHGLGVERDEVEAFKWYVKAADCGHPCAQYFLGCMYNDGRGVEKDDFMAARWLRRSAVRGNKNAQYLFGKKVFLGEGIPQNEAAGLKWLRAAACGGHADAKKFLDAYYAAEAAREKEMEFISASTCVPCSAPRFVKAPRKPAKKAVRFTRARRVRPAKKVAGPYCW